MERLEFDLLFRWFVRACMGRCGDGSGFHAHTLWVSLRVDCFGNGATSEVDRQRTGTTSWSTTFSPLQLKFCHAANGDATLRVQGVRPRFGCGRCRNRLRIGLDFHRLMTAPG
jgi:hypothetical protein